jgi:glycosyltransferase involved in cell wall biosynthesis
MWTQTRLAFEMFLNKPEVLFIPVHVLPLIHPNNSVVTLHGLEYEYYPEMYPQRHLRYLRWSTKYALKNARKIIAVSENTKKDLVELYDGNPEKIEVVYHGVGVSVRSPTPKFFRSWTPHKQPYILFVGRLETKKNVQGLIKAFNLLKRKYQVPHKLVLVGPRGYGYEDSIGHLLDKSDIIEKGYLLEQEKWSLLKNADLFVFPSFYEGFGMPILEAQAVGCPVVATNVSSIPEVAGKGAMLVEPKNIEQIAEVMYKIISDDQLKKDLIARGYQNVERFSWQKCAEETLRVLTDL